MISATVEGTVGTLTIDRPEKRNALTHTMLQGLRDSVHELVAARVHLIIVRSSSAHFSAGADLTEWANPSPDVAADMSRTGVEAFAALANAPMPTLAAIEGVAMGGGLELALACDLRVATTTARLSFPEANLGNLPAYGGLPRLAELLGRSRALELLLTASPIDGSRAAELGLVNWAVEPGDFATAVDRLSEQLTATDPRAAAMAKALVGGAPIDGVLASFTSQSAESIARKQAFLDRRASNAGGKR